MTIKISAAVQGLALLVAADLVGSEFGVGRWGRAVPAPLVVVPEAAVDSFEQTDECCAGPSFLRHAGLRPGISAMRLRGRPAMTV